MPHEISCQHGGALFCFSSRCRVALRLIFDGRRDTPFHSKKTPQVRGRRNSQLDKMDIVHLISGNYLHPINPIRSVSTEFLQLLKFLQNRLDALSHKSWKHFRSEILDRPSFLIRGRMETGKIIHPWSVELFSLNVVFPLAECRLSIQYRPDEINETR